MPAEAFDTLQVFLERGGPVLWAILAVSLWLWVRIGEGALLVLTQRAAGGAAGGEGPDGSARLAMQLAPRVSEIDALVAVLPLLGLLGTVGGMIDAFDVLAYSGSTSGSADARGLSLGISRALLTTMAGLVTSLAGFFAALPLGRRLARARHAAGESDVRSAFAVSPLLSLRAQLLGRASSREAAS